MLNKKTNTCRAECQGRIHPVTVVVYNKISNSEDQTEYVRRSLHCPSSPSMLPKMGLRLKTSSLSP
jgi:hypothetical protein